MCFRLYLFMLFNKIKMHFISDVLEIIQIMDTIIIYLKICLRQSLFDGRNVYVYCVDVNRYLMVVMSIQLCRRQSLIDGRNGYFV